jgi:hypothetical protein
MFKKSKNSKKYIKNKTTKNKTTKNKTKNNKTKNNKTKNNKKYKKNRKGGNICNNSTISCDIMDTQFSEKINPTWKTCIKMNDKYNHIIYVTSTNVLIKSIETIQIPEFYVKFSNENSVQKSSIMIEDKFIGCFLYVCGKWYAIMRLFGKTLNTQYLARTEKNKAFYEIKNIDINLNTDDPEKGGDSIIILNNNNFTEVTNKHILSSSKSKVIKMNDNCFSNINKTNDKEAFNVLQRFRQEKMFGNDVKFNMAVEIADIIL